MYLTDKLFITWHGIRWGKYAIFYKSPSDPPLFSERHGYIKSLSLGGHRLLLDVDGGVRRQPEAPDPEVLWYREDHQPLPVENHERTYPMPPGPWDKEPNRIFATARKSGYPIYMIRGPLHSWCGYVGVPENHPWFGHEHARFWGTDKWGEAPELLIDVHGGLTFSGVPHRSRASKDSWWFGFDTGHMYDQMPGMIAIHPEDPFYWRGTYRTAPYVLTQCRRMAEQLHWRVIWAKDDLWAKRLFYLGLAFTGLIFLRALFV